LGSTAPVARTVPAARDMPTPEKHSSSPGTHSVLEPVVAVLSRHAPFDRMAPAHLEFLASRIRVVFFARGETITSPDRGPADRLYIIKQGRVRGEIEPGGDHDAWELYAGECFPVGALLSRRPVRMAQRAIEDTFCFELPQDDFERLYHDSPEFQDFCSRRLASMLDRTLITLQSKISAKLSSESPSSTPLSQVVRRPPVTTGAGTTVRDAVAVMRDAHVGSIVVTDRDDRPLGIFTLHDLLARAADSDFRFESAIGDAMQSPVVSLSPDDTVYTAALVMTRESIGHVCIIDNGRLRGVVSERDLFALQRIGLVRLSRDIAQASSLDQLADRAGEIHQLIDQMVAQGIAGVQLNQLITELNDQVARRVIDLVLRETGAPDIRFSWIAFGSEGREEQTLKTDQDNGILFLLPPGMSSDAARQQLLPLATQINNALDRCGYRLCPGNVMAGNPECCLTPGEWRGRFAHWIEHGTPDHLLKASIFFDFRVIWGDGAPVRELRSWVGEQAAGTPRFLRLMAENALRNEPPLGLIRDFVVETGGAHDHQIDLKFRGVTPFVDAARILALANRVTETGTHARLRGVARAGAISVSEAAAWSDALAFVQLLRMRGHQQQARENRRLDNYLDPDKLNDLDRRVLKETFRQARKLQTRLRMDYQL